MQFIQTDVQLIDNQELTNDDIMAYSLLCDRMKSSRTSKQFFDIKFNDYYVIYTIADLAIKLKVSERKTSDILKKLVKLGYLAKKKQFSRADKLFLPQFERTELQDVHTKDAESASPYVQNLQPNQSHLNKKLNQRFNTVDTEDRNETRIEKWKQAVTGASKIPVLAVEKILDYTNNDVNKAYAIIGLINKAKYNVAKSNRLNNDPITRYENNVNIKRGLPARLVHIFNYARNAKNESAYLMNALKTFFNDAFGLVKDEIVKPVAKSENKKRVVPVPDWFDKNDENIPAPSEDAKAKVREMLKRFNAD